MAGRKKKEELLLKALRELTALPHNKKCLECQERGPTYADMTTHGFVCTSCSGYLRGLNPPHRVKSISMTTFSEGELSLLKEGGNQLAHAAWMGRWNPRHDKEPSKKDEVAFKEFLISKYERKHWYRSLAEVKKEREKDGENTPAAETKLLPPPSTKRSAGTAATFAVRPPSSTASPTPQPAPSHAPTPTITPSPSTTLPPTTAAASGGGAQKADLLGGLESDPFAPKAPPPGAVAVFPPGGVPLINSTKEALQPVGGSSGSQPTSSATTSSAADKYAALASLDMTLKELRVKDEPSPQPSPPTQHHAVQGQAFGGGSGNNPFGAPPSNMGQAQPQARQQQFNPFAVPQSQPVTGSVRPMGPGFGGGFQGAAGVMGGTMGMGQQQFQSQQFGAFGGQVVGQPMQQQVGQPVLQMGQQPGQWEQQSVQQWAQPQAFQGQMVQGQQWRAQQVMQQAPMQQQQQQQLGMQQQQWRASGAQQQMFGGGGGGMGMPPGAVQAGMGAGGFGMQQQHHQQQQQQAQIAAQQSQFGGFVSASNPQQPLTTPPSQQTKSFSSGRSGGGGGGGFNWGTNVGSAAASSSTSASVQASSARMGWSTDLSKQAPSSSGWGSGSGSANPASGTADPTGWSTSLQNVMFTSGGSGMGGAGGGGANARGWGGMVGGTSSQQQQPTNWGAVGNQPSNPFMQSSPQPHKNPFL